MSKVVPVSARTQRENGVVEPHAQIRGGNELLDAGDDVLQLDSERNGGVVSLPFLLRVAAQPDVEVVPVGESRSVRLTVSAEPAGLGIGLDLALTTEWTGLALAKERHAASISRLSPDVAQSSELASAAARGEGFLCLIGRAVSRRSRGELV